MRNDRLIPGTILVIIGTLFLLSNFNLINFDWFTFLHLWPIVLIIAGVNLVFAHNRTPWATAVKLLVLILGMGILIWGGVTKHDYRHFDTTFNFDDDDKGDDSTSNDRDTTNAGNFVEFYKPSIQTARLEINGGAAKYLIKDTSSRLFEAETHGRRKNNYNLKTTNDSTSEHLVFSTGSGKHHGFNFHFGDNHNNEAIIKLNNRPVWDIDLSIGAADLRFDLSPYKVKNLKIEGGAASFDVKMGQPLATTNVSVQAGAASVNIGIPKDAACQISVDTGLSSKDFEGFQKGGDDKYRTPGFDKAANKMYISIEGGLADFKVTRY